MESWWVLGYRSRFRVLTDSETERVYILKYMLRMIIQPEVRSPSIQKLGVLDMDRFETVAMDSLSSWFVDPKKPRNAKKKPILKEIFRVAKMEERYRKNEIGRLLSPDPVWKSYCADLEPQMPPRRFLSRPMTWS